MNHWIVELCWGEGHSLPVGSFATRAEAEAFAEGEAAAWPAEGWKRAPWAALAEFRLVAPGSGEPVT